VYEISSKFALILIVVTHIKFHFGGLVGPATVGGGKRNFNYVKHLSESIYGQQNCYELNFFTGLIFSAASYAKDCVLAYLALEAITFHV
jgi:hypothetical protein